MFERLDAIKDRYEQLTDELSKPEVLGDYNQLKKEWQQIKGSDSTSDRMLKSLDNYADFLRFAANKYKSAQANAINRANGLPRY